LIALSKILSCIIRTKLFKKLIRNLYCHRKVIQSCIMIIIYPRLHKLYIVYYRFFARWEYTNHRKIFYRQMCFSIAKMKNSFEERFFSFNRIILLAVGLWPYQQSKFASIQIAVISGILISSIAFLVCMSIIHILIIL